MENDYKLSKEEHNELFKDIKEDVFENVESQNNIPSKNPKLHKNRGR